VRGDFTVKWISSLPLVLFFSALAGAAGGFALFLYGLKNAIYKNNKYGRKFSIEIAGGTVVAAFITLPLEAVPDGYRIFLGFVIGTTWTKVLQVLRNKVTAVVEAALGSQNYASTIKEEP
jgi:hypothetical protein